MSLIVVGTHLHNSMAGNRGGGLDDRHDRSATCGRKELDGRFDKNATCNEWERIGARPEYEKRAARAGTKTEVRLQGDHISTHLNK
jgi:hypothetical protein